MKKKCSKCLAVKPTAEFYARPDRPGELRAQCKTCYSGKSDRLIRTSLWRTDGHPHAAVLHRPNANPENVEITTDGYIVGHGLPEDVLGASGSLVVNFEQGKIIAVAEHRVTIKNAHGIVDMFHWGYDGSLNRLFTRGRWKPAFWRTPGIRSKINDVFLVAVTPSLTETLASTRVPPCKL